MLGRSREKLTRNAESLVSKGKIERAIKEYRKLLADNPRDTNILNRVGDLYARIEKIDEAARLFTQIAEQYTQDGFFVKAIAIYKKIIKLEPGRLSVYERLAELYARQNLITEARTQYQVLADYYLRHDNPASAISIYNKMVELEPDNPGHHAKLAELYHQQQLIDQALEQYRQIVEILLDVDQVDQATQVYERALSVVDPEDAAAFARDAVRRLQDINEPDAAGRLRAAAVERFPEIDDRLPVVAEDDFEVGGEGLDAELTAEPPAAAPAIVDEDLEDVAGTPVDERPAPAAADDDRDPTGWEEESSDSYIAPPEDMGDSTGTAFVRGLDGEDDEGDATFGTIAEGTAGSAAFGLSEDVPSELESTGAFHGDSVEIEIDLGEDLNPTFGEDEAQVELDAGDAASGEDEISISDEDYLSEAEVLAKYGLKEKALERVREVLDRNPQSRPAYRLLILMRLNESDLDQARMLGERMAEYVTESGGRAEWEKIDGLLREVGIEIDVPEDAPQEVVDGTVAAEDPEPSFDSDSFEIDLDELELPTNLGAEFEDPEPSFDEGTFSGFDLETTDDPTETEAVPGDPALAAEVGDFDAVAVAFGVGAEAPLEADDRAMDSALVAEELAADDLAESPVAEPALAAEALAAEALEGEGAETEVVEDAELVGEAPAPVELMEVSEELDEASAAEVLAAADPEVEAPSAEDPSSTGGTHVTELESLWDDTGTFGAARPRESPTGDAAGAVPEPLPPVLAEAASDAEALPKVADPGTAAPPSRPAGKPSGHSARVNKLLESLLDEAPKSKKKKSRTEVALEELLGLAPKGAKGAKPSRRPAVPAKPASPASRVAEPVDVAAAVPSETGLSETVPPETVPSAVVPSAVVPSAVVPSAVVPSAVVPSETGLSETVPSAGAVETAPLEAQVGADESAVEVAASEVSTDDGAADEMTADGAAASAASLDELPAEAMEAEESVEVEAAGAPTEAVAAPAVDDGTSPGVVAIPFEDPDASAAVDEEDDLESSASQVRQVSLGSPVDEGDGEEHGDIEDALLGLGPAEPPPPLPTAGGAVAVAEPVSLDDTGALEEGGLEDTGTGWLDDVAAARTESGEGAAIFDEEDDFFDLGAELEEELTVSDAIGTEPAAEQSLEEIVEGFKKGVAEQLSDSDYATHLDLGIAYREMGLLDEAIGEFQIAAKSPDLLVECCSMLGVCFMEKGLPELAQKWYTSGLQAPDLSEKDTLALLYELGGVYLSTGDKEKARETFVEVYGINTHYREIVEKLQQAQG